MTSVTIYLDKETSKKLGELSCVPCHNGDIIKPVGLSKAVCIAINYYYDKEYK